MAQAMVVGRRIPTIVNYAAEWNYSVNNSMTHIYNYIGTKTKVTVPEKIAGKPTMLSQDRPFTPPYGQIIYYQDITIPKNVQFENGNGNYLFFDDNEGVSLSVNHWKIESEHLVNFVGGFVGGVFHINSSQGGVFDYSIPNSVKNMRYAYAQTYVDSSYEWDSPYPVNTDRLISNQANDISYCFAGSSLFRASDYYGACFQLPQLPPSIRNMQGYMEGASILRYSTANDQALYFSKLGLPKNGPTDMSQAFYGTSWYGADPYYYADYTDLAIPEGITVNIPKSVTNMAYCFYQSSYEWPYDYTQQSHKDVFPTTFVINTTNLTDMSYAFSEMYTETDEYYAGYWSAMQPLKFYINAPKVTNIEYCFSYINAFPIGDLKANLQNVTSLESFCRDSKLQKNGQSFIINAPNVTTLANAFRNTNTFDSVGNAPSITIQTTGKLTNIDNAFSSYGASAMDYWYGETTAPYYISINNTSNITSADYAFYNCPCLSGFPYISSNKVVNLRYTYGGSCHPTINYYNVQTGMVETDRWERLGTIPNSAQDITGIFSYSGITNCRRIPANVTNMAFAFQGCSYLGGEIYVDSNQITNMENAFLGCPNSRPKFLYIYNGTTTWNTAMNTVHGKNGVFVIDRNSVSNTGFSSNFTFVESQSKVVITNYTGSSNVVYVPDTYNGKPVYLRRVNGYYEYSSFYVSDGVFYGKSRLTDIYFGANVQIEGHNAAYMFTGCYNLRNMPSLPKNTTDMTFCFQGCTNLKQGPMIIPNTVTNMHQSFSSCYNLINVPYLDSYCSECQDMSYAFQSCYNLTGELRIPNKVTNLANICYYGGNKLSAVYINEGVTNFAYAFYSANFYNSGTGVNITIPQSAMNLYYTFYNAKGVKNISFSYNRVSANTIAQSMCWNCSDLVTTSGIPNGVVSAHYMYNYCVNLKNIRNSYIPNTVTNLYMAFANCYNFNSTVNIQNGTNNVYAQYMFNNCTNMNSTIYLGNKVNYFTYGLFGCTNFANRVYFYNNSMTNAHMQYMWNNTNASKMKYAYAYKNTSTYNGIMGSYVYASNWNVNRQSI